LKIGGLDGVLWDSNRGIPMQQSFYPRNPNHQRKPLKEIEHAKKKMEQMPKNDLVDLIDDMIVVCYF